MKWRGRVTKLETQLHARSAAILADAEQRRRESLTDEERRAQTMSDIIATVRKHWGIIRSVSRFPRREWPIPEELRCYPEPSGRGADRDIAPEARAHWTDRATQLGLGVTGREWRIFELLQLAFRRKAARDGDPPALG